jgi:carbon-monoxide dehydrogenase medium subunit
MIPAAFEYRRAKTLSDALKAIGTKDTKVICGGQSLIPMLRFRLTQPKRLVDIAGLKQLKGIAKAKGAIRIGAATTYRELLDSAMLRRQFPVIAEATEHIGDRQVRNVGTIGGALAHADPSADMPSVMLALDAVFVLQSAKKRRTVMARDYFKGPFETAMKASELLIEIHLPTMTGNTGMAYASFDQAASGYPLVGVASVITRARGTVRHARLAFTGLAECAFLADAAEQLVGTTGDAKAIERVADAAVVGVEAGDDIHASATYRLHLARVAARRSLSLAVERAG